MPVRPPIPEPAERFAMTTILVLGGTGLLGRPVVERLLADGSGVRVLARDPARAHTLLPSAVEVIAGDATSRDDVTRAAAGCAGIHLSVGGPAELASAENAAAVAPGLGVKRITYLSGSTVDERNAAFPMVAAKLAAERALAAGAVAWTVLRPTWPMEQLPRFVRDGRATIIGEQATPLHWFAADDLARMVSAAFRVEAAAGKRLYVHGPEALTMREALERYCRAEHPGVEVTVMPIDAARAAARATGNAMLGFMADLMAYFDRAGELGDSAEADRLLGPNTVDLDGWITRRREIATD
jgi:uncharacterized protein YbjT (DUF2867 family)